MILRRADWRGIAVVAVAAAAMEAFSLLVFEPRSFALACLHGQGFAPLCAARAGLAFAVHWAVPGTVALALGVWSFVCGRRGWCVAAVCAGLAGALFYNVTWGVLGAFLGVWSWLRV